MLKTMTVRATIAAMLAALSMSAHAIADSPRAVDIPAGDLRQALLEVSAQFGTDLVYSPEQVRGLKTAGAHGQLTTEQAVIKLLEGTPLELRTDPSGAMLIAPPVAPKAAPEEPAQPPKTADLEEVVVTGSHIRGGEVAAGAKLIVVERGDIDRSGYATVQDFMKVLPQNFGGGISEDSTSDPTALNLNGGTAINLRGLGADSTLVLVNGRRQAAGGLNGSFVDVSSIPAAAIERVEILPDGASAIYGSDAVGGVVNFVLRRDYSGAETDLRLGTLGGDASESRVSQLLGTTWDTGHALFGYQYYQRGALDRADREYSQSSDYRRFGGSDFRRFQSSPGNILGFDGRPAFAIPPGQNGSNLAAGDLLPGVVNYQPETGNLLARQRSHGAFFSASVHPTPSIELFADGRFGQRATHSTSGGFAMTLPVPSFNPFFVDPFGGSFSVNVAYNFLDDLGPISFDSTTRTYSGSMGAVFDLPGSWSLTSTGTYSKETADFQNRNVLDFANLFAALFSADPATAFNAFGSGAHNTPAVLTAIRSFQKNEGEANNYSGSVVASGKLFAMAGGESTMAFGVDYRKEGIVSSAFLKGARIGNSALDRRVVAGFAELSLPFVGAANARPGIQSLALSLAGRVEDYDDFGSSSNPHVGLKWTPLDSLSFRGSWGTSFKAPRLIDLDESRTANSSSGNLAFITPVEDPQAASGFSNALIVFGGNRNLEPEKSRNWSAGLDLEPVSWDGAGLSLTYFNIRYRDRIAAGGPAGNPYAVLLQESVWRDVITRNPSQAQLAPFCTPPGLGADCSVAPDVIADLRLRNLSELTTDGVDLELHDEATTAIGEFGARLNASYVLSFDQKVTRSAPAAELADTVGNPLKLRVRTSLFWSRAAYSANLMLNYADAYHDTSRTPERSVSSWTTVDLSLGYSRPAGSGWTDGLRLTANAVNLLNKRPPFVDAQYAGYDTANADLIGRVLSVELTKAW